MKKVSLVFIILILCFTLHGCDLGFASIDSLMRPPKLNGDNSRIQKAFEETVGESGTVVMKAPLNGENRSSYLLYDIDGDSTKEALVFYSDPAIDEYAYMSVFKQANEDWNCVAKVKGRSDEIYEVIFADINGDGKYEIVVSWTSLLTVDNNSYKYMSSAKRVSTVYSYDGSTLTLIYTEPFSQMLVYDFNQDSSYDILFINIDHSKEKDRTVGKFVRFNDDFSVFQSDDFTMTSLIDVLNITVDTINENGDLHTRVYVDGSITQSGLITEIIDITQRPFDISLPLFDLNISAKPPTIRDVGIFSEDFDADGIVEIPVLEALPGAIRISEENNEHSQLNLTVWSEFKNSALTVDSKYIVNSKYGYMFQFPDEWINKYTAVYNSKTATLIFYEIDSNLTLGNHIFSLKAFSEDNWEENNFGFSRLEQNGDYIYGYIIEDEYKKLVNYSFIEDNFVII